MINFNNLPSFTTGWLAFSFCILFVALFACQQQQKQRRPTTPMKRFATPEKQMRRVEFADSPSSSTSTMSPPRSGPLTRSQTRASPRKEET